MTDRIGLMSFPWQKNKFHFGTIKVVLPPILPPYLKVFIVKIVLLKNFITHYKTWFVVNNGFNYIPSIQDERHLDDLEIKRFFIDKLFLRVNSVQLPVSYTFWIIV